MICRWALGQSSGEQRIVLGEKYGALNSKPVRARGRVGKGGGRVERVRGRGRVGKGGGRVERVSARGWVGWSVVLPTDPCHSWQLPLLRLQANPPGQPRSKWGTDEE